MSEEKPIIMYGKVYLEDTEARMWLSKLNSKLDMINDRTKIHTREIKELKKEIK